MLARESRAVWSHELVRLGVPKLTAMRRATAASLLVRRPTWMAKDVAGAACGAGPARATRWQTQGLAGGSGGRGSLHFPALWPARRTFIAMVGGGGAIIPMPRLFASAPTRIPALAKGVGAGQTETERCRLRLTIVIPVPCSTWWTPFTRCHPSSASGHCCSANRCIASACRLCGLGSDRTANRANAVTTFRCHWPNWWRQR